MNQKRKKVIYTTRQTGKELYVEMVKYQVYQQFIAEDYDDKLNMRVQNIEEEWDLLHYQLINLDEISICTFSCIL